ncbi:hypothetical protein SDC9_181550 [bioreactor metagenome]|uniref:Uncharacterized protein n=1 Tax=bioreactor metagenome TaxID=1076179 RepID=A0A645H4Z1_9ZZZZ|nr:hypothetical protein [Paludibacter sp.]
MKARIIALSSFIILTSIFTVEAKDRYLKTIDSLLISIDELITNDLLEDSIILSKRPWVGLGDSWELKVFFDEKNFLFLTSLSRPDGLIKQKVNRTKLKKYFMLDTFMNHIYKHGELPYDAIAFFNFQFLQVQKCGDAVFGNYKIKVMRDNIYIIDKYVEILKGKDAIVEKQNLSW